MKFNRYKTGVIALTAVFTLGATSCRKQLNQDPFSNLSPSQAFASPERAEKASIGMYDQLQAQKFLGGRVLIYADVRGIDVNPPTYFNPLPQFSTVTATENVFVGPAWQAAYRTIGEANLFLKNVAGTAGVSAAKIDQYTGEAKFIRSLCYFYLVNLFAQPYNFSAGATHPGVPLVLTSSDAPFDPANNLPRSSVDAVYNQMIADLKDAEAKLPLNYGDAAFQNIARATKGAAQALLARVYLYKRDYTNAVAYADKIINTPAPNAYVLNADPLTTFRTYNTRESIFSVGMNGGDNPNTNDALGAHYNSTRRGDIQLSAEFVNLFEPTDLRFKNMVEVVGTATFTKKYLNLNDWVPIIRYPEVLLIKAEALANLNTTAVANQDATDLVNIVRGRALASKAAPVTKQDQIDLILAERRRELAFEGQSSFDFLRTGRGIPAHGAAAAQPFGSDYTILPIPRYDMDKNPNLKPQNPGY